MVPILATSTLSSRHLVMQKRSMWCARNSNPLRRTRHRVLKSVDLTQLPDVQPTGKLPLLETCQVHDWRNKGTADILERRDPHESSGSSTSGDEAWVGRTAPGCRGVLQSKLSTDGQSTPPPIVAKFSGNGGWRGRSRGFLHWRPHGDACMSFSCCSGRAQHA